MRYKAKNDHCIIVPVTFSNSNSAFFSNISKERKLLSSSFLLKSDLFDPEVLNLESVSVMESGIAAFLNKKKTKKRSNLLNYSSLPRFIMV